MKENASLLPIVAISGPSGSGKSRLANETKGAMHVELDRFYRSRSELLSADIPVDWEDISSYRAKDAYEFLVRLAHNEPAVVPIYDLATDSVVGEELLSPCGRIVVAEGVFAAVLASKLMADGIAVTSICLTGSRVQHACMRAWRDIREGRMSAFRAMVRTVRAMTLEEKYVSASVALGAQRTSRSGAREWLRSAVKTPPLL